MTELTIELDRLIQKAALDGALTEDAVAQFHAVLLENGALKESLEGKERFEIERNRTMEKLETDLRIAQGLNEVAAKAEVAMIEREQNITTLELNAKHEAKRVEDHKEMFDKVFRNLEVRRNVFVAPVPGGVDQYGNRGASEFPTEHQQAEKTE